MRKFVLLAVLLLMAAVPAFSGTLNVLYWTDHNNGISVIPGGITLAGATGTAASDQTDFNTKLAAGGWDVVIFGEQLSSGVFGGSSAELSAYLAGGGKIIGATWLNDAMSTFFGAGSLLSSNGSYILTDANPIFTGLGSQINLSNPGWATYDLGFNTGATCAGLLDNGGCGAVIANGNLTILNAALFDSYADQAQGEHLIANEIGYLAGVPTPEPSSLLMLGAGLAGMIGLIRRK